MSDATRFERFVTLSQYSPMGNVVPNQINCPPDQVLTDEILAEIGDAGGMQVAVTAEDNPFANDFEEIMLTWWLLSYVKIMFTANGTRFNGEWSFSKELFFEIAYKPNKGLAGSDGTERLIDCELYNEFEIRRTTENEPGPDFRIWDAFTHYFPFHGITGNQPNPEKDFPAYGLLELFCYIEPVDPEAVTNAGLLIISTRNKDYKDVIFEGTAPESNNKTQQAGFKSTTFTLFNKETTFYCSFWWIGTNLGSENENISLSDFNVEFIEKDIWRPA